MDKKQRDDVIADAVSQSIKSGYDAIRSGAGVKGAATSAARIAINTANDIRNDSKDEGKSAKDSMQDLEDGLYSIVTEGILSGLDQIDTAENPDANEAIAEAKAAAVAKARSVVSEDVGKRLNAKLSEKLKTARDKNDKSQNPSKLKSFGYDAAEMAAAEGVEGLKSVLSGDMNAEEALGNALKASKNDFTDYAADKAKEKLHSTWDKVGKSDKKGNQKEHGMVHGAADKLFSHGIDGAASVIKGDMSASDAAKEVAKATAKDITDEATEKLVEKMAEKVGVPKIDALDALNTAAGLKDNLGDFLNGDINGIELAMKTGDSGLQRAAENMGKAIGKKLVKKFGFKGVASKIATTASATIMGLVYGKVFDYIEQTFEEERISAERLKYIREIAAEAKKALAAERENILQTTEALLKEQEMLTENLHGIENALAGDDADGLISSLNKITESVGGEVQFKTFEELDNAMMDDSFVLDL